MLKSPSAMGHITSLTALNTLRMRESNPEPSGNKFTKSQHHEPKHEGKTFTGFIDWEE